jgi:hypothetical protein
MLRRLAVTILARPAGRDEQLIPSDRLARLSSSRIDKAVDPLSVDGGGFYDRIKFELLRSWLGI